MLLFLGRDGFFGGAKLAVGRGTRFHFDKGDGLTVISHQINFAFHPPINEVSRDHDVSGTAEIPIGVRLATNAGPTCLLLGRFRGRRLARMSKSPSCSPVNQAKYSSSENRQRLFLLSL